MTEKSYRLVAIVCGALILTGCIVGVMVPAGLGWDFANFYDTGRRAAAGQFGDLYSPAAVIQGTLPQGSMEFWGTPISAILYLPLSWFQPKTALVLFKIGGVISCLVGLGLLYRHCRQSIDDAVGDHWAFTAAFTFLALTFQPFWTVFRVGGQTTPIIFLLLIIGLLCHTRDRLGYSALLYVLVVLMKPAFAPALLLLMLVSERHFAGWTILTLIAVGAISLGTMGWGIHEVFLRKLLGGMALTKSWLYSSSLFILIQAAREEGLARVVPGAVLALATLAIKLGVVATIATIFWRARSRPLTASARRHFGFVMSLAFFILISQTLWDHYLAVLFPVLISLVVFWPKLGAELRLLIVAIFVACLGQNQIAVDLLSSWFTFDSPLALTAVVLFKSAPVWLLWILLIRHWQAVANASVGVVEGGFGALGTGTIS